MRISASVSELEDLGFDKREAIMQRWDIWRAHIAGGGGASWPRDEFEALIDGYEEEISQLKTAQKPAQADKS